MRKRIIKTINIYLIMWQVHYFGKLKKMLQFCALVEGLVQTFIIISESVPENIIK